MKHKLNHKPNHKPIDLISAAYKTGFKKGVSSKKEHTCKHRYHMTGVTKKKPRRIEIWCDKCNGLWEMAIVPTKYYAYHKLRKV